MAVARRRGLFVASTITLLVLVTARSSVQQADVSRQAGTSSLQGIQQAVIPNDNFFINPSSSRRLEEAEKEENQDGDANEEKQEQQEANEEVEEQEDEEQEQEKEENNDEREDEREAENANEEEDNSQNGYDEIISNAKDTFQNVMDRLDEDAVNMWVTSPSEWNEEFWEVFAIIAGIATLIVSCLIYICCLCCCGANEYKNSDYIVATKSQAEARDRKRWSISRNRTRENETGHNTNVTSNWESPFVLIDDIEKGNTKPGFASPVYDGVGTNEGVSPLSTKTGKISHDVSTRAIGSPESKGTANYGPTTFVADSTDDNETTAHSRSIAPDPSIGEPKGIVSETVEVWSEFLGFKKSKYNMPPRIETQDEDDIDSTFDEKKSRGRSRSHSRIPLKRKSSKSSLSQGIEKPEKTSSQMSTTPYKLDGAEEFYGEDGSDNRHSTRTPILSNSSTRKPTSPRRTALLKTKNLLRSIGHNKTRSTHKRTSVQTSDMNETSLLNDETTSENV